MSETYFIKSKQPQGFRRAGVHVPAEGIVLDGKTLSPIQLQSMKQEPMLLVEIHQESKPPDKSAEAPVKAAKTEESKPPAKAKKE